MRPHTGRTKGVLVALLLLSTVVPLGVLETGDAVECTPKCDDCHYAHDRVYWAFLDITRFTTPTSLDGVERKRVEVQLRLHGNVGLGYTTVSWGWVELTSNSGYVAVDGPKQEFRSYAPGFRSFFWNVSGRLAGTDTLHVEVYALGVHLDVEYYEEADSGSIVVTNPVNAPPRVSFGEPDGYFDLASRDFTIELLIDEPNADPILGDFYYDTDRDRENGTTVIQRNVADPTTLVWDTRGVPDGWYYIHVDVDDQRGGTDSATSYHPVIVSHQNNVPNVELALPMDGGTVYDPVVPLSWRAEDRDGDPLSFQVWVGRGLDRMELVGTTTETGFDYAPDDNARLFWTVIPDDGQIRGWCRNGPRTFSTEIAYPVEVDLVLPPDGSIVPGPTVKLVWYGRDLDYEQVLYDVFLMHGTETRRLVRDWDDPGGPVLLVPDLAPGETYTWWVEGDNIYSDKGVSERWSFTLADEGLPVVDLLEERLEGDTAILTWSPSSTGTTPRHYDVHLVEHRGGDRLLVEGTNTTSTVVHDLVEDTRYSWYVIPYDDEARQGHSVPAHRSFTYDVNSPPSVSIPQPLLEVGPGPHTLEWEGRDGEGDAVTYDVYMDPVNATALVAANISEERLTVVLEPDRFYFWKVVPRDALSMGREARAIRVTGPAGTSEGASGRLLRPLEGQTVAPPVVNLTWEGLDGLNRTLLYDIYLDAEGGDPLSNEPLAVNQTSTWFRTEVGPGTQVSWAVEVHPIDGPRALLGTATFTVAEGGTPMPVAVLSVDGQPPGSPASVRALEGTSFNASGPPPPGEGAVGYLFDFGDGRSSGWVEAPSIDHTYLSEGTYNASLTVRDASGRESEPAVVRVEVGPGDLGSSDEVPGAPPVLVATAILAAAVLMTSARGGRTGRGLRRGDA